MQFDEMPGMKVKFAKPIKFGKNVHVFQIFNFFTTKDVSNLFSILTKMSLKMEALFT